MMEENVVASAGVSFRMSEEEIVATIRDAGFDAARRKEHLRFRKGAA
jgi:cyclic dehypoxanthinyl futalosine synthase